MFEEKIKKYVNDQWFYASNKMACDPNLTTEYNLRNWINVLNKTHKDAKNPFEKECLKAYICFFSNWILHEKDLSKAYEALDNYLNNNFTSKKIPPSSSKRPNRSIQNSKKREDLLGAALAVSWNFRDQCKNVSDLCKQIDTRAEILFPDLDEPPFMHSTMEKHLSNWVNKFK